LANQLSSLNYVYDSDEVVRRVQDNDDDDEEEPNRFIDRQDIEYEESSSSSEEDGAADEGYKPKVTNASEYSRFHREREKD
jgi:hypothetical protein